MKFLVDACLSPALAERLRDAGHDAIFIADIGSPSAPDSEVIALASQQVRVILTADSDFSTELANSGAFKPSIVFFRRTTNRRTTQQAMLLLAQFESLRNDLEEGSIIVIEESRVRIRPLPMDLRLRNTLHAAVHALLS